MAIDNINYNVSFNARQRRDNSKSQFDRFADAFDSTTQNLEAFDDFMLNAKQAVDSPEDAAMRVLSNKLNKVADNNKSPKCVRKAASLGSAAIITTVTFFATKNVVKAPGKFANMAKDYLVNHNKGQRLLNFAHGAKIKYLDFIEEISKSKLGDAKRYVGGKLASAINYLTNRFPEEAKKAADLKKTLKLDEWSKNDYIRNGFSGLVALTSGIGYIKKQNKKFKEEQLKAEIPTDDVEINKDAA